MSQSTSRDTVRPAETRDGEALGRMGAALARLHHEFDPQRFMLPDQVERGYRSWLVRELADPEAVVLVAEHDGTVVGYAYGRSEGKDWNRLLDRHGKLIDLWVDATARHKGIARHLVMAMVDRLTAMGAPRVVLEAAAPNAAAQKLFASLGFRATMAEMTRESKP